MQAIKLWVSQLGEQKLQLLLVVKHNRSRQGSKIVQALNRWFLVSRATIRGQRYVVVLSSYDYMSLYLVDFSLRFDSLRLFLYSIVFSFYVLDVEWYDCWCRKGDSNIAIQVINLQPFRLGRGCLVRNNTFVESPFLGLSLNPQSGLSTLESVI